jgi:hypothetical protein
MLSSHIQLINHGERINLARVGNRDLRRILIREPIKAVQVAVLNNPRITEGEIEQIASSKTIDDEILRIISNNRQWMKNYAIKVAIVKNPRTPLSTSLRFLPHLRDKDLNHLALNKNVSSAIAVAARRLFQKRRVQRQGR